MAHISQHLYTAKGTRNPIRGLYWLTRAAWAAMRQGRTQELLYFASERLRGNLARAGLRGSRPPISMRLDLSESASPRRAPSSAHADLCSTFVSSDDGAPIRVFVLDEEDVMPEGRTFQTRRQSIARIGRAMVVLGEYDVTGAPGARLVVLDLARRRLRIALDLRSRYGAKHIHLVHYRSERRELLVCTGDRRKPLYAFSMDPERLVLGEPRIIRRNNAGYTAAVRWNDSVLFGTDFFAQENSLVRFSDEGFERFYLPRAIRGCFFVDAAPLARSDGERVVFSFGSVEPFMRTGFLIFDLGLRKVIYAAHGPFKQCRLDIHPDGSAGGVLIAGHRLDLSGFQIGQRPSGVPLAGAGSSR